MDWHKAKTIDVFSVSYHNESLTNYLFFTKPLAEAYISDDMEQHPTRWPSRYNVEEIEVVVSWGE